MEILVERILISITASMLLTLIVRIIPFLRNLYEVKLFEKIGYPRSYKHLEQAYVNSNPNTNWASVVVKVNEFKEEVSFPTWDSHILYSKPEIINELSLQFADQFQKFISPNTMICATNDLSFFFLQNLNEWFQENGCVVFQYKKESQVPEEWKKSNLILFDVNINTGKTLKTVNQYFMKSNWEPIHYIVAFNNDLVPRTAFISPNANWPKRFSYIHSASGIIKYWKDQNAAKAVKIIQDVLTNRRAWDDPVVKDSLKYTRTKPKIQGKPNLDISNN